MASETLIEVNTSSSSETRARSLRDKDGNIWVVYRDSSYHIYVEKSADNGATWGSKTQITNFISTDPTIAYDGPNGYLYVAYKNHSAAPTYTYDMKRITISTLSVTSAKAWSGSGYNSLFTLTFDVLSNGDLALGWVGSAGTGKITFFKVQSWASLSQTNGTQLTANNATKICICADHYNDSFWVAWTEGAGANDDKDLKVKRYSNGGVQEQSVLIESSLTNGNIYDVNMDVDEDGNMYIAYASYEYNVSALNIRGRYWNGSIQPAHNFTTETTGIRWGAVVSHDLDGNFYIVWSDVSVTDRPFYYKSFDGSSYSAKTTLSDDTSKATRSIPAQARSRSNGGTSGKPPQTGVFITTSWADTTYDEYIFEDVSAWDGGGGGKKNNMIMVM